MPLSKVVSGGQTGVDRAALDAALEVGFPCGGWCPAGRIAEDGVIAARYPLVEMATGGYRERTAQNVRDSDGTLILYFARLSGGTEQTLAECIAQRKPYELIDGAEVAAARAAELALGFVAESEVSVLNVAGPRSSHCPEAYAYAYDAVTRLLCQPQREQPAADARPPVGVAHVIMHTDRMAESADFMRKVGMRAIFDGPEVSVYEMRGGTHLILMSKAEVARGEASFDLMVDDLHATHRHLASLRLDPSPIESRAAIDHEVFTVREPAGHVITFFSSHASGRPV